MTVFTSPSEHSSRYSPGVHRAYVPVTVGGDVRSQGPGDEIAAGVAAGLLSGDISPVYHALHQGVVLGDAGDAVLRDVISPAVPHVGDHHAAVIGDGGHQGSAHVPAFLPALCLRLNGLIGQGCRLGGCLQQLLRGLIRRQELLQLLQIDGDGDLAGHTAPGGAAHAVAHHAHRAAGGRVLRRDVGVLVLLPDKADVGHAPDVHLVHWEHSPFCASSMAFRRSCPQEASISPPRLRRTVAVMPWDSSRF